MSEFFVNLWNGILANKDQIVMFLTSAEFVGLIGTLVALIKTHRTNKSNNKLNAKLSADLSSMTILSTDISDLKTQNEQLQTELSDVKQEFKNFKEEVAERDALLLSKLNAILEVQNVVYSTSIRDDDIRNTVTNILINAKYCETAQRAALKKQLEELKNHVVNKAEAVAEEVKETIHKAEIIMDATDTSEIVQRY